ncbi:MAG: phosphate signaling complex protein PhoU [Betaproteobacteria bacterium]|nr:phosphate signaling complex protein PhoU [Betaproteobacteria bacterium]
MTDKHLSTQFDSELSDVSSRVLEIGGMVEAQLADAINALLNGNAAAADRAAASGPRVNALEMEIDSEITSIIARRQPAARDLRLLIAISKATANLERVGDEAEKIARMMKTIINNGHINRVPSAELRVAADLAAALLRKSLDGFARLDTTLAVSILKDDDLIDIEFNGFVRKLITYLMEDPRKISMSLELLFVAKALERIGDHAKNIAEFTIYIVKGADVRHTSLDEVESAVQSAN